MQKNFLEHELREGYLVELRMKRVWEVQLKLLNKFKEVCDKYELNFFAMYGTLLGSIRHNGYIPWDDDIDITMPREDYNKLNEIAENVFEEPFFYQTKENEKDFFIGGASRLRYSNSTAYEYIHYGHQFNSGIWIDITPLDYKPNGFLKKKLQNYMIHVYQRIMFAKIYSRDNQYFLDISKAEMKILYIFSKIWEHDEICKKLDKWSQIMKGKKTHKVGVLMQYGVYEGQEYKTKWFEDKTFKKFEHFNLPVPKDYKECLEVIYGKKYMEIPSQEEKMHRHVGYYNPTMKYKEISYKISGTFNKIYGKEVIIFGVGEMFQHYWMKYGDKYPPSILVDNNETLWGRQKYGIDIISPNQLNTIINSETHIIICSIYFLEIIEQLKKLGINDCYIYTQKREWVIDRLQKWEEDRGEDI